MRSQASFTSASLMPMPRSERSHTGRWSRLTSELSSSWAPVTPRMTETRLVSRVSVLKPDTSSSTARATMSARSWEVSVAGRMEGGMPKPIASNATSSRKAPRLA